MLAEAQQSKNNGCVIGYFFLCYYVLFHAMQANLFLDNRISDGEILQLFHSKVNSYFKDFYCKESKSIMPHETIDLFQKLRWFREVYSYDMLFNNPRSLSVDIEQLTYYIKLCFQLCNLKSLIINQIQNSVRINEQDIHAIYDYFAKCCYKKDSVTGEQIKDISDEIFLHEVTEHGCVDFM